jgi:predicted nucleic acid-binding protein
MALITYAEICYGIEKSPRKKQEIKEKLNRIVSLIETIQMEMEAAHHYTQIRVLLESAGTIISEREQITNISYRFHH